MKKGVAIGLLIIGSLVAIGGISVANLILFFVIYGPGLLLAILVTAGAVFGITRLHGVFERHYGVSALKFGLLAFVPSLAASLVAYIAFRILDKAGYFKGFFAGLGEYLFSLTWLITSGAAAVIGTIMLVISCARKRAKAE